MSKNYVWYSTQESRENHTTSILAIIETIFFVILTWGIAYYFDTSIHIYAALAIAPFLLLKTPASTEKAIEWFLYTKTINKKNYYQNPIFTIIIITNILVVFLCTYLLSSKILINYHGFELIFLSILLGSGLVGLGGGIIIGSGVKDESNNLNQIGIIAIVIGVIIGVETLEEKIGAVIGIILAGAGTILIKKVENKLLKIFTFLVFSPLILIQTSILGLSILLKSITIKFIITTTHTIFHPKITFFTISKNWNEYITINDSLYSPELLPAIHKKSNEYQVSKFISNFKKEDLFNKLLTLGIALTWSLAYIYRFSIKSTAWFFFPLAYLANLTALEDEIKQKRAIKIQTWKGLFYFNVVVLLSVLLYFGLDKIIHLMPFGDKLVNISKVISEFLHQHIITNSIWLIVTSVILYVIISAILSLQKHLEEENIILSNIIIYWLIKLIYMLWMVFLGWHIVVFTNQYVLPELPKIFGMP